MSLTFSKVVSTIVVRCCSITMATRNILENLEHLFMNWIFKMSREKSELNTRDKKNIERIQPENVYTWK